MTRPTADHGAIIRMQAGVSHTRRFVEASLAPGRLLEVGCGTGELAVALARSGFDVYGIDTDARRIRAARARGLEAAVSDILEFEDGPFEAVLFSRSLHHVHDPAAALERAHRSLAPRGVVLIEDFGHDLIDTPGAAWLYETVDLLGSSTGRDGQGLGEHPLSRWRGEHPADHLHGAKVLDEATRRVLPGARKTEVPYLYRYLLDPLGTGPEALAKGEALLRQEEDLIRSRRLSPIGLRWTWRSD